MSIDVAALRGCDIGEATEVLVRSFWEEEGTLHLVPSERMRASALRRIMHNACVDALPFDSSLVARSEGQLVGVALVLPPEANPTSLVRQLRQALAALPIGIRHPTIISEAVRGSRAKGRLEPSGPHLHLSTIGVEPQAQGRGVGSVLLERIVATADQGGLGTYLTTYNADTANWYAGFGFEITNTSRPTQTWPEVSVMWRNPESP